MNGSFMNEGLDKVKESIKPEPDNSDDDELEFKLQEDVCPEKQNSQTNRSPQFNKNVSLLPMAISKKKMNCRLEETELSICEEQLSSFHDKVVKISDSLVGSEKLTSGTVITFHNVPRISVCAGKKRSNIRKRKVDKGKHARTEILQSLKSKLSRVRGDAERPLSPICFTGNREERAVAECEKSQAHSKDCDLLDETPVSRDPSECSLPFNTKNPEKYITESITPTVFLKDLSALHKISVSGHGIDTRLPSLTPVSKNNNPKITVGIESVGPNIIPDDKSVTSNIPVREFIPGSKLVPYYLVVHGTPPESSVPANTHTSTITSSTKSQTRRVPTKTVVECVVPTIPRSREVSACSKTAPAIIHNTSICKNSNVHASKSPTKKVLTICRPPPSNSPVNVQESPDSTTANSSASVLTLVEDSGAPVKNPRLHTVPSIPVIMHGTHTVVTSAGSEQTSSQDNVLLTVASLLNIMKGSTSLSKDGNAQVQYAPEIKDNPTLSTLTSVIRNTSMVSKTIKSRLICPVFSSSSYQAEVADNVQGVKCMPERSNNSVLICSSQTSFAGNSSENEKTITLPYSTVKKFSVGERTKDDEQSSEARPVSLLTTYNNLDNKMLEDCIYSNVRKSTNSEDRNLISKSEKNCVPVREGTQEGVETVLTTEADSISSYEELDPEEDNCQVQEGKEPEEDTCDSSDEYVKRQRKKERVSDASYDPETNDDEVSKKKRSNNKVGEVSVFRGSSFVSVDKTSPDVSDQNRYLKVSVVKRPSKVTIDKTSSNVSVEESTSDLFVSVGTVEFSRAQFFDFIFEERNDEAFLCKNCGESLESKEESLCHMLEHRPFKCLRCSDTYPSEKALKYHMSKHNDKKCCTHCPFSTTSHDAFAEHMKKEHHSESARMQSWMCHICGMVFTQQKAMEDHMKDVHNSMSDKREGDIECPVCKAICISAKMFRDHMLKHLGKFIYCSFDGCKYKTVNKSTLDTHKKNTHGERTFSCPIEGCGFTIQRARYLDVHLNTVHYKVRKFKCTYCNKGFVAEKHLQVHLRIHLDLKPIGCKYCDYKCRQKAALNWHMKKKHVDKKIENKGNRKFEFKPGRKPTKSKKKSTQNVDGGTVELDLLKRSSSRLKRKKLSNSEGSNSEGETEDVSNGCKEVTNIKTRTRSQNHKEEVRDHDFISDKKAKKPSTDNASSKEYELQRARTKEGKQYLIIMGKK